MKFDITLTWSKLMTLFILITSSWYSLANHEATVITLGIVTIGIVLGWKQQKDKEKLKITENEKNTN